VRQLVRQHFRFFLLATVAALALRLVFLFRFPAITADSLVYGDIAKNWLQKGIYGLGGNGVSPTYIRVPGYPAFLAAIFALFGMEHYRAVLVVQVLFDIGTCFLTADLARRMISGRAAKAAFLLAALCPFLANYAAAALAECLEIFFTALALDLACAGLESMDQGRIRFWLGCGLTTGIGILLRPDGGLLLVAIVAYLACLGLVRVRSHRPVSRPIVAMLVVVVTALLPLVPWAIRNLRTFHRFELLAPRYANEENSFVPEGFNRWVKTWMADYVSVEEIYWNVPGEALDADKLPARAFDSDLQRQETQQLLNEYNTTLYIAPDLDARFAELAAERIRAAPLRYYLRLPLTRIADMWLRPRTEILPSDTRWWEFNDDPFGSVLAVALGVFGILYLGLALMGLWWGAPIHYSGLLLTFLVLRSAFLGTLENPEPRYTLECFPVVIVLASAWFGRHCRHSPESATT
jgi:4-amino-4-deoxy-L-arabinose transferase-like glycosyltransferase